MDNVSTQTNPEKKHTCRNELSFEERECPKCGFNSISGMRGSADAICKNCGYKDPCCFD